MVSEVTSHGPQLVDLVRKLQPLNLGHKLRGQMTHGRQPN